MKKILQYLKSFAKEDFRISTYLFTAIFLVVTISLNYYYDFEDTIIGAEYRTYKGILAYFAFYSFAWYSIALWISIVEGKGYHKKKLFWILPPLFLLVLSIDGGFYYHEYLLDEMYSLTKPEYYYLHRLYNNIYPAFLYFFCLWAIKFYSKDREKGLYGLRWEGFDPKPYLIFLLIMTPLIAWASFRPDFQDAYPQLKPWLVQNAFGYSEKYLTALFEFFYLFDFITVELLFRGALIVGLTSIMGKDVLLPMVATYAFLHFGKPWPETIGSVFGGYILGIIAYETRSILGGCSIHMGVALLMELFALIQYYLGGAR